MERVDLEVLAAPDERAARLANGGAIGVSLLQQAFVEGIAHLALRLQHLVGRYALLRLVDVHHLAVPAAPAQSDFAVGVGHKVGLRNLALYRLRQLSRQFDDVRALVLDGLRNLHDVRYLLQHAAQLRVEVVVVIDDAQVRMSLPGAVHPLVQVARQPQSFLVGLLVARGVGGRGIVLLGTVGRRNQVQHGIVAPSQGIAIGATLLAQLVPHLWFYIGRDVHRATVADDECRLRARLGQPHERVLQGQLRLEDGQFALVVQVVVRRQVAPPAQAVECRHFGHGKHLEAQVREMLDNAHQCCCLAGAGAARQYDSLDVLFHSVFSLCLLMSAA